MSAEMSKMWHRQNTKSLLMRYKVCEKGIIVMMMMMMMIIDDINNIGNNDDKINSDHHHYHHLSEWRRRPREGSCN